MSDPSFDQALALAADHHKSGRLQNAETIYRQVLARDPKNFHALQLLGLLAYQMGHLRDAIGLMEQACAIDNCVGPVRCNLGYALRDAKLLDFALNEANAAIGCDPKFTNAIQLRGAVLFELRRFEESACAWESLIALAPERADAHANLAATLENLGRLDAALESARHAISLDPNNPTALVNLGSVLQKLGQPTEAITHHRKATQLAPKFTPAWINLASVAQDLGKLDESASASRRAIELAPNDPGGHRNLALTLSEMGQLEEAEREFATTIALMEQADPPEPELIARLRVVSAAMLPAVYESTDDIRKWRGRLCDGIAGLKTSGVRLNLDVTPAQTLFALAYQGYDDRAINTDFASLMLAPPDVPIARKREGRIRVGFISRFFRDHTIGRLNQGLIDQLDREQFVPIVFSVRGSDETVARFIRERAEEHFYISSNLAAARQAICDAKLDVLLYTDIGMDPVTFALAHSRLAPVQCVTWGHPVTTGIPAVDYFISSESLESPGSEAQYTEKLVKLKSLAVYYRKPELLSAKGKPDFGIDENATVYGCLQMLWKFHPAFDAILGEVLRRDPRGIVIIVEGLTKQWDQQLMARFKRTIPDVADRIRFLPRVGYNDFLALTSCCDVMLDPIHFGGGNTTYEALAFGVPVVTLPSQFLRGRISKALYDAMGMDDCVARDAADYVEIASRLGLDRDYRQTVRDRIFSSNSSIFENSTGVRELETFVNSIVTVCR